MNDLQETARSLAKGVVTRGYLRGLEHSLYFVENCNKETAIDAIKKMIEKQKEELAHE